MADDTSSSDIAQMSSALTFNRMAVLGTLVALVAVGTSGTVETWLELVGIAIGSGLLTGVAMRLVLRMMAALGA